MLSYYVMHDVVNNLEEKYKEQFSSFDRIFFSANYIKVLDFYNLTSFKANPYPLKNIFENTKQKELIDFLIKEIKENKFDEKIILMTYSIIINKVIYNNVTPFYSSLCGVGSTLKIQKKKQKLERIISYHLRDVFVNKNRDYKKVPSTYSFTKIELDTLTSVFKNVYNLSNTKEILKLSEKNFYFYYNQNINFLVFKRCYYRYFDRNSKSKVALRPTLKTKLYKKKIDYLNLGKKGWVDPYSNTICDYSFMEIYNNIITECSEKISLLNKHIFYNEKNYKIIETNDFITSNSQLTNPIFSRKTIFKK